MSRLNKILGTAAFLAALYSPLSANAAGGTKLFSKEELCREVPTHQLCSGSAQSGESQTPSTTAPPATPPAETPPSQSSTEAAPYEPDPKLKLEVVDLSPCPERTEIVCPEVLPAEQPSYFRLVPHLGFYSAANFKGSKQLEAGVQAGLRLDDYSYLNFGAGGILPLGSGRYGNLESTVHELSSDRPDLQKFELIQRTFQPKYFIDAGVSWEPSDKDLRLIFSLGIKLSAADESRQTTFSQTLGDSTIEREGPLQRRTKWGIGPQLGVGFGTPRFYGLIPNLTGEFGLLVYDPTGQPNVSIYGGVKLSWPIDLK